MEDRRICDEIFIEHQYEWDIRDSAGLFTTKKLDIIGVSWVYDGDITNYELIQYGGYVKIAILCGAVSL